MFNKHIFIYKIVKYLNKKMITIHLTEGKRRNIIKETLNKVFNENKSIIEIKYFHPSGKTLLNGSFYQLK